MRRKKHRLPIPQHEFGFVPDTFALIQETGLDGERLARERIETKLTRAVAEASQARLFTTQRNKQA